MLKANSHILRRTLHRTVLGVLLSAAWCLALNKGLAQPANDNFANAEVISGDAGSVLGDNFNATSETGEPLHNGLPTLSGASVWYAWTAPVNGAISFDTVGSDFDTVLAAYSGSSLANLQPLAGNDDFDPKIIGPSRISFNVKSGTTYYIAVDGFDFDFDFVFGSVQGNIVLNWKSGLSAGTFQFTKVNFIVSDGEDFPAVWTSMGPQAAADLGARVTVTRSFGAVGKVFVDYQVSSAFYTNTYITNVFGTNILTTNVDSGGGMSFTNYYNTNFTSTNFYQTLFDGKFTPLCGIPSSRSITISNIDGDVTIVTTNYGQVALTNSPCRNQNFTGTTITTNGSVVTTVTTTTNIFCTTFITNRIEAAAPFFTTVTNTLEFDDYQMSKTFLVKNVGFRYSGLTPANGALALKLTGVRLSPLETVPIAPPTLNTNVSTIEVKRYDIGAIPFDGEQADGRGLPSVNPPCSDQGFIFNFERATLRVVESGAATHTNRFVVYRDGTNNGSCSVRYRVDFLYPFQNAQHQFNQFNLLESGSDFATPVDPYAQYPSAQPPDFFGDNGPQLTGTLNWGANDFTAKNIDIVITNDNIVEFNEDLLLQLYEPSPAAKLNPNGMPPTPGAVVGQIGRAVMTILFDDQPAGAVDRTFNSDNSNATDPIPNNPNPGANGTVYATATQFDQKTVIGGNFVSYNTIAVNRIARMTTTGLLDQTFDVGSGANDSVTALAIEPAGKILVGGAFTSINGSSRRSIARLNQNGSVDTSFKPGLGANGTVWSIVIQPDGKSVISGLFTSVDGTNRNHVARLNIDGSLDATFDPGVGPNGTVFALGIQSGGKIIIGGEFDTVGSVRRGSIARLNADGTLDSTFNPSSGTEDAQSRDPGIVYSIAIQANGKILAGGAFNYFNLESRNSIARINTDGSLDTTFDPGSGANHTIYSVKLQPDGRVLIGGLFSSFNSTRRIGVARLLANGDLDTSFMDTAYNQFAGLINPYYTDFTVLGTNNSRNFAFSLSLQDDGGVIVGGGFSHGGGGGSRDAIRPRQNVARLIGGATPGPGNIELTYNNYSADENGQKLYVTLARVNGNLGPAQATFSPVQLDSGAGAAVEGVDYTFNAGAYGKPTWRVSWPRDTWMQLDGIYGQNNNTFDVLGESVTYTPDLDDVFVDLIDNSAVDGNRNLRFQLSQPNGTDIFFLGGENIPLGVALGRDEATVSITDNDVPSGVLAFGATNYTVSENITNAVLNVIREDGSVGPVTVSYIVSSGTALYGQDYLTNQQNTLIFSEGETNKQILIPIIDDSEVELDEMFTVTLVVSTGGATLNTNRLSTIVTIVDNDFAPGRISFLSSTFTTNESKPFATIRLARNGGNVGVISVKASATDGTAINGLDFTAVTNTLTWNSGDTSIKTFTVPILNDGIVEGNETVNLQLFDPIVSGVTNNTALGGQSNAVLVIEDDDFYGDLQFSSPNFFVNENGAFATITVLREHGSAEALSVGYSTSDGTAISGVHYISTSGVLNFAPGDVVKTFTVQIIDDGALTNVNRIVNLSLFNPTPSGVMITQSNATLTILDNESSNELAGSLDTAFSQAAGANDFIYALALQKDGKLLFGGDFTTLNKTPRNRIGRLNPTGTIDTNFSNILPTSGANDSVRALITQTDGRILIGGLFTKVNNVNQNHISRLNFNGALDTLFNPGSGADGFIYGLAETFAGENRKILAVGKFTTFNGFSRSGIAQLNDDGTVDSAFDPGSGVNGTNGSIFCVAVQADGKVVIGGDFISFNGVSTPRIARLNTDGSLDTNFNANVLPDDSVRAIAIQQDGKIIIGGLFTHLVGGEFNHVARLNTNGTVDNTFVAGVGANDPVYSIAIQAFDGKILLGGEFTRANGVTRNRLTRLMPDGTVDPTINFGDGADSFVDGIVVQPDAKIVIVGGFTEFDGTARPHLARLYGGSISGSGRLEFDSAHYEVDENQTNAVITVRRLGGSDQTVSVLASTSDETAIAGVDYVAVTTNLVFAPGETRESFVVPIINNDLVEADKTVHLALSNSTADSLGNQQTATLTIRNDDSAISFASSTYQIAENSVGQGAIIQVVRQGSAVGTCSIDVLTTTNGTATPTNDFILITNQTVVFLEGETNKTIFVPIVDDNLIEGDETVVLLLTNAVNALLAEPSTAVLTIVDNESGPGALMFSQPAYSVSEGAGTATITVTRTNGLLGFVAVNFNVAGGTAIIGSDYTPTNGTLVFGDGEMTKSFSVKILNDSIPENDKTVLLTLSNPGGGATLFGTNVAVLTILDDDVGFGFSTPAYVVNEGDGSATIAVRRQNGSNGVASISYRTSNGTAFAGIDYVGITNTLQFADGENLKTFTIPILDDSIVETEEFFSVILFNPTGGSQLISPSNAVVTIADNDSSVTFGATDYTVDEGGTNVVVTVVRTNTSAGIFTVNFATSNNTAVAGSDFGGTNGTLIFLNGESVKQIIIPIVDDTAVEGNETFTVRLSNPGTNAVLGIPNIATVTIVDNDAGIKFSSPTYRISESGVNATITVLRTIVTNSTVSVTYKSENGTATEGADYLNTSGVLTFTNGETVKTFTIPIIDDTVIEGDETVLLSLLAPSGQATLIAPSAAVLTIADNDGSLILPAGVALISENIAPTNGVIDPGETVSLFFALRNSVGSDTTSLVATLLATNGITAPSGPQNYGVLTVNGGSASRQFTFTATGTNGQQITATFQLNDGALDLGIATFTFTLGKSSISFSNSALIVINDSSNPSTIATPYPSTIAVSGISGTANKVSVTLSNLTHSFPDDIDMLLVSPTGEKILLMSDVGGGSPISNRILTFDDDASVSLPNSTLIASGSYKPTNYNTNDDGSVSIPADFFPSPAPSGIYSTNLSILNGVNPNGIWSLFVVDDTFFNSGKISNGWSLAFSTSSGLTPTADLSVMMSDSPDPAATNSDLTYTVTVRNYGPSAATGVMVTNVLPAGFSYVSNNCNCLSFNNGVLVRSIPSLPKDGVVTFQIVVHPNVVGTITNVISVSGNQFDPNLLNNTATESTVIDVPQTDLSVSVTDSPDPVQINGSITYGIVVSNMGPATANGVLLTNTLPMGAVVLSVSESQGSHVTESNLVIFTLGDLESVTVNSSRRATLSIVVKPTIAGVITNEASVAASTLDPFKSNNSASVKTVVELPPLAVSASGSGLAIDWNTNAPGYRLESTTNLSANAVWEPVNGSAVVLQNGKYHYTFNPATGNKFFRLSPQTP